MTESTWNGLRRTTPLKAKTPLQRKTPLQNKTELKARSELKSKSELTAKAPLQRKSRMKATPSKRHYGHLVKNGWCACCGMGSLETEWHHIIFRSQGGDESDENMLEVCRDCHAKIHDGRITKDEVAFARLTAGSYLEENQRVIGAKA